MIKISDSTSTSAMSGLRIIIILPCVLFSALLLLTACTEKKDFSALSSVSEHVDKDSFIIALLPQQNVFEQKKKYGPLARYLSRAMDMTVKTKLLDSYEAVYSEMMQNKVDSAVFGSLSFVVTDSKVPMEPIARPVTSDNVSTYRGNIVVRKDSGITDDVKTWKGKRIALVSKSTTAGYIFPRSYLHEHGVDNFEGFFSQVFFLGSHDAAILAVVRGDADIASASDLIVKEILRENPLLREDLTIITESVPVPNNTIAVLSECDSAVKDRFREALLTMHMSPDGKDALSLLGKSHYIVTEKSDFSPIVEMLSSLGLGTDFFTLGEIGKGAFLKPRQRPSS